ncbi:hypothetical protein [Streptomyces sp. NPDC020965]|uniref:hypothetical protein n=1 Tax=Streptomyces sp. NPDC020965 TaxID=3365105 RepID=UPI0037925163
MTTDSAPDPPRTGIGTDGTAVRWAGRLVCWTLGAAMATSAVEAFLKPTPEWWQTAWVAPWPLFHLFLLGWAVLRFREKRRRWPTDPDGDDD